MPAGKLTARGATTTKPGTYGDGAGLWLVVAPSGARKWLYRFSWQGKVTQMGLGSADVVSLAEARDLRDGARKVLASGINPIEARRAARQGAEATKMTFGQIADQYFETKKGEYRNDKYREMVRLALIRTAAPLRPLLVDEIDTEAVLAALKPIWVATPETGKRFREKIEAVLDAATAKGLRSGENPARWKGHLEHLLPKRKKVEKSHHAAMDYRDLPALINKLRGADATAALALEFCILTAARSGEVYGARWSEIDTFAKVWTIPPHRMKAGREHRIPLCHRALEILKQLELVKVGEFVFSSPRGNRPLSHVAMAKVLDRIGVTDATIHGFRSSFRDWAGHETAFPREIAEQALAHRLGDAAELAYKRGDFLEKRRELMEAWGRHCESKAVSVPARR